MRKYVSLATLTVAATVLADKIAASQPGDELRALYLADSELAEAIAAATKEPEPKVGGADKAAARAKRAATRAAKKSDVVSPFSGSTTEPQL